ncbi:hypothetical protein FOA43_001140 [Brettanomyces nanus]|uniref:Uncharacterized protein n=1 Tax=Eeniella nana TaxID=13502 RepID=A0A875S0H9_EENNA|nr:uncharacterized protein FOA43_001140 [Brettanomyces nanus]QPG73825.1 hypothetical protein FOA43_001140 [Brettanomyces nanus]
MKFSTQTLIAIASVLARSSFAAPLADAKAVAVADAEDDGCTTTQRTYHRHHQHKRAVAYDYVYVTVTVDGDGQTMTPTVEVVETSEVASSEDVAAATTADASSSESTSSASTSSSNSDSSSDSSSSSSTGITGDLSDFVDPTEEFEDGTVACSDFPSGNGVIALDWLDYGGWSGLYHDDTSTGGSCEDGTYCSYACQPGMSKSQWPSTQPSNGVSVGGLYCKDGYLYKTSTTSNYLCEWGENTARVVSEISDSVAICRTDYPGTENMVIPTVVDGGSEAILSVVDEDSYYQWEGKKTSAQFYVNNAGVSVEDGCIWGTSGSGVGNWAPLNFGAGATGGITYLSLIPNPNNLDAPNYNVKIVAYDSSSSLNGDCVYEDGVYNGDGSDGCTVALTSGKANLVGMVSRVCQSIAILPVHAYEFGEDKSEREPEVGPQKNPEKNPQTDSERDSQKESQKNHENESEYICDDAFSQGELEMPSEHELYDSNTLAEVGSSGHQTDDATTLVGEVSNEKEPEEKGSDLSAVLQDVLAMSQVQDKLLKKHEKFQDRINKRLYAIRREHRIQLKRLFTKTKKQLEELLEQEEKLFNRIDRS